MISFEKVPKRISPTSLFFQFKLGCFIFYYKSDVFIKVNNFSLENSSGKYFVWASRSSLSIKFFKNKFPSFSFPNKNLSETVNIAYIATFSYMSLP